MTEPAAIGSKVQLILDEVKLSTRLSFFRFLLWVEIIVYGSWWFVVNWAFPESYNPLSTRLVVIFLALATYVLSFRSAYVRRHIEPLYYVNLYLLTLHNFHLKHLNYDNIAWPVSTYITVFAVSACFHSRRALLFYSLFVFALGLGSSYLHHFAFAFYLPGLATILVVGYIALSYRQSILEKLAAATTFIEEAQRKNAETLAALKERNEFIALASHELNTPLTPIRITNDMLLRANANQRLGEIAPDKLQKVLETSGRAIDRLDRLIGDMLDVSAMNEGPLTLKPEDFDLRAVLDGVVGALAGQAEATQTPIDIRAPSVLPVHGDRSRLEQALKNVVKNALIYGRGKKVSVGVRRSKQGVVMSIHDRGMGIAPKDQERIFGRFERAVPSNQYGGLGLGLYMTKKVIDAHGGKIRLRSKPGQGARFTILI